MTVAEMAVVRVSGPLRDALEARALETIGTDALASFLSKRRWFGSKGRVPTSARFSNVVPVEFPGTTAALATIDVEIRGQRLRYSLPLAVIAGEPNEDLTRPVLATVESSEGRGAIVDATGDPAFRAGLGKAVSQGGRFQAGETAWVGEPVSDAAATLLADVTQSKVGSAEQSNTSIVYGGKAMFKLFRKLEAGQHPDAEIAAFLTTRTGFRGTPELLGTLRIEHAGGEPTVAGMMQRFVPGAADAWSHALNTSRPFFASGGEGSKTVPFAADAGTLGRVTRELHEALASVDDEPDFAPVKATEEDLEHWADAARESVDEGLVLLVERLEAGVLPRERVDEAKALAERGDVYHEFADELADRVGEDAGLRIRHHGDYHLGQVIRGSSGDFSIIDFEGEPARPLAARREKQSPLRDVAGMLRSFAYAAATLASEQRGKRDARELESVSARWEKAVREAFLASYLGVSSGRAGLLPGSRSGIDGLIALFELEKVFYELGYELNNRPEWVWIPLRGAARLLYR